MRKIGQQRVWELIARNIFIAPDWLRPAMDALYIICLLHAVLLVSDDDDDGLMNFFYINLKLHQNAWLAFTTSNHAIGKKCVSKSKSH